MWPWSLSTSTLLAEGIARVRQARGSEAWDVTIVDNASTDGSLDALHDSPDLRVMRNDENVGFGVACNQAARVGDAPWIVFLNPLAGVVQAFKWGVLGIEELNVTAFVIDIGLTLLVLLSGLWYFSRVEGQAVDRS